MYDEATGESNHGVRFGAIALTATLGVWGAYGWYLHMVSGKTGFIVGAGYLMMVLAFTAQVLAAMASAQTRRAATKHLEAAKWLWGVLAVGFSGFGAFSASHAWETSGAAAYLQGNGIATFAINALFWFLALSEPWLAWLIETVERAPMPEPVKDPILVNGKPVVREVKSRNNSKKTTTEIDADGIVDFMAAQDGRKNPASRTAGVAVSAIASVLAANALTHAEPAQATTFPTEDVDSDAQSAIELRQASLDFGFAAPTETQSVGLRAFMSLSQEEIRSVKARIVRELLTTEQTDAQVARAITGETGVDVKRLVVLRLRQQMAKTYGRLAVNTAQTAAA